MAITNAVLGWTNIDTVNPLSGYKRAIVWFSRGEIPSIATLNSGYSISWDGAPVETTWSEISYRDWRGVLRTLATHPGGSIRAAMAEFSASLPAGAAAPTEHTIEATVVARANTPPAASFDETAIGQLELAVQYTDDENSADYGPVDVMDMARSGNNSATLHDDDIGLRKLIFAEGYMGRGKHHAPTRALGHNDFGGAANPPVEIDGNLHVLMDWEFPSGESWGIVTVEFANDLLCPYPAEPPDDGAAFPGHPTRESLRHGHSGDRPTKIRYSEFIHGVEISEELDSPIVRHIQDLQIRIQRTGGGTCHVYPMYTNDASTGAGPYGTISDAGSGWWNIPIEGLRYMQGWGLRFAVSFNSAAEAEQIAKMYTAYYGMMKYAESWDANDIPSGSLVGVRRTMESFPYTGDRLDMAGIEVALHRRMPEATITGWFAGGASEYSSWIGSTNANHYDRLGRSVYPPAGGPHPEILWMQKGDIYFAASSHRLYIEGGRQLRWYSAGAPVVWQLDRQSTDFLSHYRGGRKSHSLLTAGGGRVNGNSVHSAGLFQSSQSSPQRSFYDGDEFDESHPDPQYAVGDWGPWDDEHWGAWPLFYWAVYSADPWALRRLYSLAYWWTGQYHQTGYGSNFAPQGLQGRGEVRPLRTIGIQGHIVSGDEELGTTVADRLVGWVDTTCLTQWGDVLFKYTAGGQPDGYPCAYPANPALAVNMDGREWTIWQISGIILPFLVLYAYEFGDPSTANAQQFEGARLAGRAAEHICKMVVERFSLLDPARVSAAGALVCSLDACWPNIVNEKPLAQQSGFAFPKHVGIDLAASSYWDPVMWATYMKDVGPSNSGQVTHHCPLLFIAEIFKKNLHQTPGFRERLRLLRQLLLTQRPELANGQNWNSVDGAAWYESAPDADPGPQPAPQPTFTATPARGEVPLSVNFDASGSTIGGSIAAATFRWWAHYDGVSEPDTVITGAVGLSWQHTYGSAGVFSPYLEVTDDNGETGTFGIVGGVNVTAGQVDPPPAAFFDIDDPDGEAPHLVNFDAADTSVGGNENLVVWEWWAHWGVGNPQYRRAVGPTGRTWQYTYLAGGDFSPRLRVTDDRGRQSIFELTNGIRVTEPQIPDPPIPTFSVNPGSGEDPLTVDFDASGSVIGGDIASATFRWYFDEDEASPTQTIVGVGGLTWQYEYTSQGTYSPKLEVEDEHGQIGEFILIDGVLVHAGSAVDVDPEFTVGPATIEPGEYVALTNITAIGAGAQVTAWSWEYRGPDTGEEWVEFSTDQDPVELALILAGDYDFRLTATGPHGSPVETALDAVTVEAPTLTPTAAFETTHAVSERRILYVRFTNQSENYVRAVWSFGDGSGYIGETPPVHVYDEPGSYTVRLRVENAGGEFDETTKVVTLLTGRESFANFEVDVAEDAGFDAGG